MDALKCLKTRRSIRKFKDKEVPDDIIEDILECGRNAPSSWDTQPWVFVVIKDKESLNKLSRISPYSSSIANAPLCIVVCLAPGERNYKPSNYLSIACAVENMLLAIHAHGLGSCWTFIKDFDDTDVEKKAKDILNIPEDVEAICMLPIGYPDEEPEERTLKNREDIVYKEQFGKN